MPSINQKSYVVAVSGGVDSCVLLHQLATAGRADAVAHADHGMRPDSGDDARFVQALAARYGLAYYGTELDLGPRASEAEARRARYAWLDEVNLARNAGGVATAHHLDDAIETACINILRGTGWRGLASLRSTDTRYRPLLAMTKADIIAYARTNGLQWRDDPSNQTQYYLRNRVRRILRAKLTDVDRKRLKEVLTAQAQLRPKIEAETAQLLQTVQGGLLRRYDLIMMSDNAAVELLGAWVQAPLPRQRLTHLLLFCRTAQPGTRWSLDGRRFVSANQRVVRRGWDC
ncbi:MAG TPA: tRNA lysidine(34) synthetase TilS [Candidatus Saccharimonadales bacterium]|jgi:tRNA(Ile)-lysidine synthase